MTDLPPCFYKGDNFCDFLFAFFVFFFFFAQELFPSKQGSNLKGNVENRSDFNIAWLQTHSR